MSSQCLELRTLKRSQTCILNGNGYKRPNLCHGTCGNGYAFLYLYQKKGELLWLNSARKFAMHAIEQCKKSCIQYGLEMRELQYICTTVCTLKKRQYRG
ncbi:MAG: hypothetical protein GY919_00250 [Photobacterium aquimaris]|nr:hypothetical protein [Photobacterium aquimaris]